jgi:hypothetical protein
MKILQVGVEFFNTDDQTHTETDGQREKNRNDEANNRFSQFCLPA